MEGNRRIVFFEPGSPLGNTTLDGKIARRPPITHVVYAMRQDKSSAGEGTFFGNIEGGQWFREYTIRQESLVRKPTENWWVEDEDGEYLDIVGISEKSSGPWARHLVITCVHRKPGE